jgi:uncharacterized protein YgiM (DUF1202 family)
MRFCIGDHMPFRRRRLGPGLLLATALLAAVPAAAQEVWVKDEVRLNVRTGAGNQYRITGALQTGDSVRVVERATGWTRVRLADGSDGWVPAGFLMDEPPAAIRMPRMEAETRELRDTVERLREEVATLSGDRGRLETSESSMRSRAQELEAENMKLKAGARWPEWITGAGILAAGMLVGSIVQALTSRRPRTRIRL